MTKKIVGLMSGTSLDGIDGALVDISEDEGDLKVELVEFISKSYEKDFREKILKCTDDKRSSVKDICRLNVEIGEKFANTVFSLMDKADMTSAELDLIGSHGQTIYHDVESDDFVSTLQVGSGSFIAERTGVSTVYNFRMRDVAAGGEGAPLVPYVDHLLYTDERKNRVLQNIGGIGNYSYLPADGELEDVLGSDTGPGNMLIDNAVNILSDGKLSYDKDGEIAKKGDLSKELLDFMMEHSFIAKSAPKSTGRKDFGKEYAEEIVNRAKKINLSDEDIVATITAYTAYSIIDAYNRFIPDKIDQIIIGGGGSYNPQLLSMIETYAKKYLSDDIEVLTQEEMGYSSEAKEAIAFAVLAYETMKGKSNNIPQATGAKKAVILGDIVPGEDFYEYIKW